MRLKYTTGEVILVFVSPLLRHSLLSLPLEAKLILMAISPTIATMKPHKLRFGLGLWLLTWFLSARLLHRFLLTSLLTLFPKEHFPEVLTKLIGFWKSFVGGGNTGGAGVVSSRFLRWLGLGGGSFMWWVFGGSGIFSPLPSPTSFAPSPSILPLECLDHHPQLRLMTRQPTHQLSQLIILILQAINIMHKFQILQSMHFTGRARCRNRFFQLSLKGSSVNMHLINFSMQDRARSAST
jgi:hypothetical protein